MDTDKTCFVIAPIGEAESETRKRSDQILKHIVSPAAKECGYEALRADQISEPGMITSQVIQTIVDAPLVLADLTDQNPNVFYELAIRHAIRKPLVQIIKRGDAIPFDVASMRTISVDHHDLDSVEEAKKEIVKQIKSVEKDVSQVDTPISVALELQLLRQSENPEQRSLAEVVKGISELQSRLLSIDQRLTEPESRIPSELIEASRRPPRHPALSHRYMRDLDILTQELNAHLSGERPSEADRHMAKELSKQIQMMSRRMLIDE